MSGPLLFYWFGMPVVIAALGWAAVLLHEWDERRQNRHADE